jgi:hypothetical protein
MPRGQNGVSFRKTTQTHDKELQSDIYLLEASVSKSPGYSILENRLPN